VVRWRHHLDRGWPAGSRRGQSGGGVKIGGEPLKDEKAEIDKPVHGGKAAVMLRVRNTKMLEGAPATPARDPMGNWGCTWNSEPWSSDDTMHYYAWLTSSRVSRAGIQSNKLK
jgi:hypothetical protein